CCCVRHSRRASCLSPAHLINNVVVCQSATLLTCSVRAGIGCDVQQTAPFHVAASRARDPESTRDAILVAAQAMMAERGIAGLTVSAVARRAGVTRGTAYQHFPSRDELVTAVLGRVAAETKLAINATVPPTVNQRIDHAIDYFLHHPEFVRLTM